MNGHISQGPGEQHNSTQFSKTVETLDACVKKNMMYHADLAPLFATKRENPTIALPTEVSLSAGELACMIFQEEVKDYVKSNHVLQSNLATVYTIISGQ
jgi:hypothetical protein